MLRSGYDYATVMPLSIQLMMLGTYIRPTHFATHVVNCIRKEEDSVHTLGQYLFRFHPRRYLGRDLSDIVLMIVKVSYFHK